MSSPLRRGLLLAAVGALACQASDRSVTGVNPVAHESASVATVTVSPSTATGNVGDAAQFTATLKDDHGNVLTGLTVAWSSSNTAVVTVNSTGYATAVGAGSASLVATSNGKSGTAQITVNGSSSPVPVATVTVSPSSATGNVGDAAQFSATTKDANGNVLTGRTITWSSTNTAVATVSSTGYAKAVGAGSASLVATSEGKSGAAQITVNGSSTPVPVATVTVSPATATGNVGDAAQFTATTKDANGNVLTGRTITWSSTNTAVATVSSTGYAKAVGAGTASLVATSEGKSGQAQITVNGSTPVPVASVTVSPSSATGNVGDAAQFTATTKDANGNVLTGRTVTWSSTNTSVVTVNSTGYAKAVGAGSASLVATSEGKSGTAQITVNGTSGPAPVATVAVSPSSATIAVGSTQTFSVVLKDASGNVLTGRTVTWSSSAPLIAGVSTTGVATALLAGTSTITATSEGKSGSASLTVTALPPPPSSGSWPNQPSGLNLLSDQPWSSLGGWQLNDNTAGHTSLVTLSGLPFSPSGALQDLFPVGMTGGGADALGPGRADFFIPTSQQPTEIYVGMWAKLSNPYQPHSSGVQKLMYLHDNNGIYFSALWLEIYGTAAPFRASLVNQFYGCPSIRIDPNATQTAVRPGEWHRYELYLKMASTSSSSDGVLKVWVDGTLNVSRSDVCTRGSNSTKMESVRLSGMWGGIGDLKTETDYLWYDHTYVSGR